MQHKTPVMVATELGVERPVVMSQLHILLSSLATQMVIAQLSCAIHVTILV